MPGQKIRNFLIFLLLMGLTSCARMPEPPPVKEGVRYQVGSGAGPSQKFTLAELEALGARSMTSVYFDKVMDYPDTRFTAISFARLLERFPAGESDAVLLNCFDDYQGILSMEDVRRYNLHLATRIRLAPEVTPPGWLNPLLVLVPDGQAAPYQERFMTANIREVRLVKLANYYAPLEAIAGDSKLAGAGLQVFKDNCVFCHQIRGVGGNKGGNLPARFDFKSREGRDRFRTAFQGFHRDNPDKQNIAQFLEDGDLQNLAAFMEYAL